MERTTSTCSMEMLPRSHSRESLNKVVDSGRDEWRIRERIRTVSAGLVLCLHLGVDPPDVYKTNPSARLECWTEPDEVKAKETIATNLQQQFEFWQPRARFKTLSDPTVEELRKLCQSLRKFSKEERVLFHYNGHGVPRPTKRGELWCFNKQFTQYIPITISEIHSSLGSPSIIIFDCSGAGNLFDIYKRIAETGEDILILGSCGADEILPMAPEMPADIFTACLTTPMEIAIRWHVYRAGTLLPNISLEAALAIPGRLNDRRTPLGELNWILTAITDTIAWTILPRQTFKKLFRQDVLVASLYRNFLLAIRILKSFRCNAVSWPNISINKVVCHEMWHCWDHALDRCLSQYNDIYEQSPFFIGQMDSFELWIRQQSILDNSSAQHVTSIHLPIVLQVLLSQNHRSRALQILGYFTDLGDWAILDALNVGIFPYILKLFQSPSSEIRYQLLYLWLRILLFDPGCSADLVKEDVLVYFERLLTDKLEDSIELIETRTMALVCLCLIFLNLSSEEKNLITSNFSKSSDLEATLLNFASGGSPPLVEWSLYLMSLLSFKSSLIISICQNVVRDERFENRIAAVRTIASLIPRLDTLKGDLETHEMEIIQILLYCANDCNPKVRVECLVAFSNLIYKHQSKFVLAAYDLAEVRRQRKHYEPVNLENVTVQGSGDFVRKNSWYTLIWKSCLILSIDPFEAVSNLAVSLVDEIQINYLLKESRLQSSTSIGKGLFVNKSTLSTSLEKVNWKNSFPFDSPAIQEAAHSFVGQQKNRRLSMQRLSNDLVQAKIKKLQIVESMDAFRWNETPPNSRKFTHEVTCFNVGTPILTTLFHPLEDTLYIADRHNMISEWDFLSKERLGKVEINPNSTPIKGSLITGLACVDWDPMKILAATNDGIIRLYNGEFKMISSWNVGILPLNLEEDTTNALLMEWNQYQRKLFTLAAGKVLAILDATKEQIIQNVIMSEGITASSMTSDRRETPIVTLGFSDGWIRRYDLRQPDSAISTFKGHDAWILGLEQPSNSLGHDLLSASISGDIIRWDLRQNSSTLRIEPYRPTELLSFNAHPQISILACAGSDQTVKLFDSDTANPLGHLKWHDGFLGQRIDPVMSINFHQRKLLMATGGGDGIVSIYSPG